MSKTCEDLDEKYRKICTGEAPLPLLKINQYRKEWGIEPLLEEDLPDIPRLQAVVHKGKANIPYLQSSSTATIKPSGKGCGCNKKKERSKQNYITHSRTFEPEGVGTELVEIFKNKGAPPCERCKKLALKMNEWGVQGCLDNMEYIIEDIIPRARVWLDKDYSWAKSMFTAFGNLSLKLAIKHYVKQAIKNYQKKQKQCEGGNCG